MILHAYSSNPGHLLPKLSSSWIGAGADPQKPKIPVKAKQESEAKLMKGMVDVSRLDMTPAGLQSGLERHMQVSQVPVDQSPLVFP